MADVSQIIWETCKTYLFQQGKFILMLEVLSQHHVLYFGVAGAGVGRVLMILAFRLSRHRRQLRRRLVRHSHQHLRQLAHRFAASKASRTRFMPFRSRPA